MPQPQPCGTGTIGVINASPELTYILNFYERTNFTPTYKSKNNCNLQEIITSRVNKDYPCSAMTFVAALEITRKRCCGKCEECKL